MVASFCLSNIKSIMKFSTMSDIYITLTVYYWIQEVINYKMCHYFMYTKKEKMFLIKIHNAINWKRWTQVSEM